MAIFSFNVRMIDQNELKTNVIFFHIRNQHIIYTNGHIISLILPGDIDVLTREHYISMNNGCIICNSGHFNVEINIEDLKSLSVNINKNVRDFVDEYILEDNKRIYLIADGRLVNLASAEGHPAMVMDMSFSTQAMSVEYLKSNKELLENKVLNVPLDIEKYIATTKLRTLNIEIDKLSEKQENYLKSWEYGT